VILPFEYEMINSLTGTKAWVLKDEAGEMYVMDIITKKKIESQ
jgi:hypothetical protein